MGQMTTGIMLGIEVPKGLVLCAEDREDESDEDGVLENWAEECAPRVEALAAKLGCAPWQVEHRYVPDTECDGGRYLVGFWVAVGASGREGVPSLEGAFPIDGVRQRFPKAHARAVRRWQRFARWLRGRGFITPDAQLWLTTTEVA